MGGLSLELRTALDLATLLKEKGALLEAHGILSTVFNQFTDGFDTGDLGTRANSSGNWNGLQAIQHAHHKTKRPCFYQAASGSN